MAAIPEAEKMAAPQTWPNEIFEALLAQEVRQVAYVPDAGHKELIERCAAEKTMEMVPLTTEEEGVALLAGAWLGGQRGVLLMQSSGVGNCVNTLSLVANCRFPLLMLVTMRGEWAEFNPWQVPMGVATQPVLETMGVKTLRVDDPADVEDAVSSAMTLAFEAGQAVAVLLSQRMLGRKEW